MRSSQSRRRWPHSAKPRTRMRPATVRHTRPEGNASTGSKQFLGEFAEPVAAAITALPNETTALEIRVGELGAAFLRGRAAWPDRRWSRNSTCRTQSR
jgi:hypothetical protein